MSQSTALPEKPSIEALRSITPPPSRQPSTWAAVASAIAGFPEIAFQVLHTDLIPFPTWFRHALAIVAFVCIIAMPLLVRTGTNDAAARVQETTPSLTDLAQVHDRLRQLEEAVQGADVPITRGDLSSTPPSFLPQGPGARNPGA